MFRRAQLTYIGIVIVAGVWLIFQQSFVPKTSTLAENLVAKLPAALILSHPDILEKVQKSGGSDVGGYVEPALPESILGLIDEEDEDNADKSVVAATKSRPKGIDEIGEQDYDFAPERLSPILKGRKGKQILGHFPTNGPKLPKADEFSLIWDYGAEEKLVPYVGNDHFVKLFDPSTERRSYLNSLAVFPFSTKSEQGDGSQTRYHGHVGVYANGTEAWVPEPTPLPFEDENVNKTAVMKRGGFYLDMANALPMDRIVKDQRDAVCKRTGWDYKAMANEDVSVVITFYNEPLATLLRTVHSVLNYTPPSLLREIILVDDHSSLPENLPGDDLYEYVKVLPKTKILRLPERRGLVWARLAGAQASQGTILVVLDSHVEVNPGWIEPQVVRLMESPKSIVFPQILGIDTHNFDHVADRGIGCWLSWKWNMVEQASLTGKLTSDDPIPSASMAGGLFATRLDWFWEIGGYDEEFAMWGSENVEMGFRTWMCGGRLECTPCSLTYHIYRDHGIGYHSPDVSVWTNKLRTARLWMDEHWLIAKEFIGTQGILGNVTTILEMKERLKCKPFKWFLENVDPTHDIQSLDDVEFFGELRLRNTKLCIDSLSHDEGGTWGTYQCHNQGGSQKWLKDKNYGRIRSGSNESACLSKKMGDIEEGASNTEIVHCTDPRSFVWTYNNNTGQLEYEWNEEKLCVTAVDMKQLVSLLPCDEKNERQKWEFDPWVKPKFEPLTLERAG